MQSSFKSPAARHENLKRIFIYSIATLFLGSLQCAFFPMLDFCPQTPDILLAMLVAIALLDSITCAAVCSVAFGFFIDAIGAGAISFTPLIYFFIVAVIAMFSAKVLKSFPSFLLLLLPALVCRGMATYLCTAIVDRALPSISILVDVILPEALCSAIFAIPIYFLVKLCTVPLQSHSRFTF